MQFWKDHAKLRVLLIAGFFIAGLALVIIGWNITGKLSGLALMLAGLVFLLTALFIYNKPFDSSEERKGRKKPKA